VNGFDHQGWLEMSDYYIQAFKTGTYPTISQDKVYLWARPHPRDAFAPDPIPRPDNAELVSDMHLYFTIFDAYMYHTDR
jgi:glucan endo-1,3-alpha-glucosidase